MADGTVLHGCSVGAACDRLGEVVFNTGMTGYQEILSDPSYCGQFVTMTYPEIGNTGANADDMECQQVFASGLIVHELNNSSNWRSQEGLSEFLKRWNVPAIAGIDTRALTVLLREKGTQKAYMAVSQSGGATDGRLIDEATAIRKAREWEGLDGQDYASRVSCREIYRWDPDGNLTRSWGIADKLPDPDLRVVAYDFGIKWNILRSLRRSGMDVTVVPASTPAKTVFGMKPDAVVLSNGPADPAAVTCAIEAAREMLGKIPLMGICLGHQLLGLALGGRTYRLKFGHHGCNHPVMDLTTRQVQITSQNHNFAVDRTSLDPAKVEITHINLNDRTVEGFYSKKLRMLAVQYHPEAAPGPHDAFYLFERFRRLITNGTAD